MNNLYQERKKLPILQDTYVVESQVMKQPQFIYFVIPLQIIQLKNTKMPSSLFPDTTCNNGYLNVPGYYNNNDFEIPLTQSFIDNWVLIG